MSEPEMVLRVAKAIEAALHDPHMPSVARAAIEAMREPTKKMIRRGADQCDGSEFAAEDTWETMIDAALAEPTAPR